MTCGKTRRMVVVALIAAAYTAISLTLGEFGFGPVQFRVSEALTLLAVFSPICIEGLTLGCFLTNAVGVAMGLNILGPLDMLFGTAATLLAAFLSYLFRRVRIGKVPVLSSLPPVVINAVVIGLELAVVNPGGFNWAMFGVFAGQVFIGQAVACCALGLPLIYALEKAGLDKKLFGAKSLEA